MEMLGRKQLVMGFGHRVYKTSDHAAASSKNGRASSPQKRETLASIPFPNASKQ